MDKGFFVVLLHRQPYFIYLLDKLRYLYSVKKRRMTRTYHWLTSISFVAQLIIIMNVLLWGLSFLLYFVQKWKLFDMYQLKKLVNILLVSGAVVVNNTFLIVWVMYFNINLLLSKATSLLYLLNGNSLSHLYTCKYETVFNRVLSSLIIIIVDRRMSATHLSCVYICILASQNYLVNIITYKSWWKTFF